MEKSFRGTVTTNESGPSFEKMAEKPEDVPWPCISGPQVPSTDPKLWINPRRDMNSSLAFLRQELASMQLQDRTIHKQLLTLNSAILGLKTALNESWEQEEQSETEVEAVCYPTETSETVTKVEVVNSTNREPQRAQVSHAKQDSGILTDEDSEEENDVFVSEPTKAQQTRVRSVSVMNLPSYHSSIDIDINNNKITQSVRSTLTNTLANSHTFQAFSLSIPRPRSHTVSEGQFHRVTSMPVINEIPGQDSTNSKLKEKAFAIYGYMRDSNNNNNMGNNSTTRAYPLNFKPLSRHGSMPIISGYTESRPVHHYRSQTEPVQFPRGLFNSSFSGHPAQSANRPVTRASSQMDLRRIDQQHDVKPYRIYRTSSQVSLV